jgi:hypothetical protein
MPGMDELWVIGCIWEGMQKVRAFAIAFEATRAVYAGDG